MVALTEPRAPVDRDEGVHEEVEDQEAARCRVSDSNSADAIIAHHGRDSTERHTMSAGYMIGRRYVYGIN